MAMTWLCAGGAGAQVAPAAAPVPRLAAILAFGPERRATFAWPDGPPVTLSAGEAIGAFHVTAIGPDAVRIERPGEALELEIAGLGGTARAVTPSSGETRGIALYAQSPAPD